jgi:phosphonate transport system substrate-binding protein
MKKRSKSLELRLDRKNRRGLMRSVFSSLSIALVGAAFFAAAPASLADTVIALKPDKDPDAMLAEREQLAAFLKEAGIADPKVVVPMSGAVILEGFANGTIDAAYVSATDMAMARERAVAELLLAGLIDGKPHYQSYWVALAAKPYASVEDLAGKPVAFASRTSTSGFVIPYWDLVKRGKLAKGDDPAKFFGEGNVIYGAGYVSAIERLFSGDAEAAAVSYYVLDRDKHLSAEQRGKLKKIAGQGPVPTHVIAVRKSLEAGQKAALRTAMLKLNEAGRSGLRDRLFTSELAPVDETAHLESISEALELVRAIR